MTPRLDRQRLIEIVRRLQRADGTEEELDLLEDMLENSVLDPQVSNLIYHTTPELTPEEIVDRALAYRPIQLGGEVTEK